MKEVEDNEKLGISGHADVFANVTNVRHSRQPETKHQALHGHSLRDNLGLISGGAGGGGGGEDIAEGVD